MLSRAELLDRYKELRDAPEEVVQAAVEHAQVLKEALDVMVQRSASYGAIWRQYGALNNLVRAATKVDRAMEVWWRNGGPTEMHKDVLDDPMDAINYLAFFIALARSLDITGTPPERPVDMVARQRERHA